MVELPNTSVLLDDTSWWSDYFKPKRLANSCTTDSKWRTHTHHSRRVKQFRDSLRLLILESKPTSGLYCIRGYQSYALSPFLCSPENQMQWGITKNEHTVAQKNAPRFSQNSERPLMLSSARSVQMLHVQPSMPMSSTWTLSLRLPVHSVDAHKMALHTR